MIVLDLSILNQKGTPMFNSDTLANRPAAGIVGRIFIAIDSPFGIYRDTGTAWDQISGASTFSGSLATGQVAFGSATNTISGTNNLFWNSANNRLGINTNTPTAALQVVGTIRATNIGTPLLFSEGSDQLGLATQGGTIGLLINATTRNVEIKNGVFGDTGQRLQVAGQSIFTNPPAYQVRISDGTFKWDLWAVANVSNTDLRFVDNNGVNAMILYQGGNVSIGNNNSNARLSITGAGATSATNALQVQNSSGINILTIANNAQTTLRGSTAFDGDNAINIINGFNQSIFNIWNSGIVFVNYVGGSARFNIGSRSLYDTGTTFEISGNVTNNILNGGDGGFSTNFIRNGTFGGTNGNTNHVSITANFATSITGATFYNSLRLNPTINQAGGATGITRGLLISPTLTSAVEWRSIDWSNNTGWGLYGTGTALNYLGGTLGIKTTSPYSPSTFSLDVNGGLLVKNTAGTTAQITLINADPSIGGNNGFLVASVGGTSGGSYVDFQGYYGTSIVGSTALRLNPAGGSVIVNSTSNTGEQFQLTGTLRINGQQSATSGGNSGQHLIINLDGTTYKIKLELP